MFAPTIPFCQNVPSLRSDTRDRSKRRRWCFRRTGLHFRDGPFRAEGVGHLAFFFIGQDTPFAEPVLCIGSPVLFCFFALRRKRSTVFPGIHRPTGFTLALRTHMKFRPVAQVDGAFGVVVELSGSVGVVTGGFKAGLHGD